jgi:D-glycero-D-manno-heptose 1,7-bisphosphate phosphatase
MKSKALFLDRDGVINAEQGYVHCREDFHFQEGIFELCRAAQIRRYLLVIVTNQAGIARGYYTEAEFLALTEWMVQRFADQGIQIARVYYCPYHPIHGVGAYKYDSPDRKPLPGMLLRAKVDFSLDLTASVLIGDKLSDILAADAAGVGAKILLRSGATEIDVHARQCLVAGSLDEIRSRFFSAAPE